MPGIYHQAGCCCGGKVCGETVPLSMWYTDDIDVDDPERELYPLTWTQAASFYKNVVPTLWCASARPLCPGWTHEYGEYSPWMSVGDNLNDRWNCEALATKYTMDFSMTPNLDVHVGVEQGHYVDDRATVWVDGTRRFAGKYNEPPRSPSLRWDELDGSNCVQGNERYFVTSVAAGMPIRVQIHAIDIMTVWATFGWGLTFWYDGNPAPATWPNSLKLRVTDNQ